MSRVLITGGRGYVATHLSGHLAAKGHEVVLLSRKVTPSAYPVFEWSIPRGWIDERAFEGVDVIVNLAGATIGKRWTRRQRHRIYSSRIEGTRLLYERLSSQLHNVHTYIGASATGYYGHRPGEMLDETASPASSFLGETAVAWEKEHHRMAGLGIRTVILRQGLVFGRDAVITRAFLLPIRFGINPVAGDGKQTFSWIHVTDLVRAMEHFINRTDLSGTYNVTAPHSVTNRELCDALKRAFGKRTLPTRAPSWFIRLMLGKQSELILGSRELSSQKLLDTGFLFRYTTFLDAAREMAVSGGSYR